MSTGKFACFACRKVFSHGFPGGAVSRFMTSEQLRAHRISEVDRESKMAQVCPSCSGALTFVGINFKTPKASDSRSWREAESKFGTAGA
ncbi:MAG: hypothetical protein AB7F38_00195 [Piscinibacter sp.]|jgi:hypothetical protein